MLNPAAAVAAAAAAKAEPTLAGQTIMGWQWIIGTTARKQYPFSVALSDTVNVVLNTLQFVFRLLILEHSLFVQFANPFSCFVQQDPLRGERPGCGITGQ